MQPFAVVAHRGASGYEPENTLRALKRAIEMGADMVEVDVRLSKDGVPVIIHDETLDRTTDGSGKVADYTADQLRMFDAGSGEKIPLLSEVLDFVKGKVGLLLELKEVETSKPALKMVEEKNMVNQVMFISFHREALEEIAQIRLDTFRGLIYARSGDHLVVAKRMRCLAVAPYYRLATTKAISFAHRLGLKVNVWTIDDLKTARIMAERGVDSITTNKPDLMISLREELSKG
ncbi:glycerophosphodiester phosphodiesterase [Candidatus Bathyarchaeota archaeon]|nr:MAG: glycerophosphodiester phosphodiesterase [Candidatus Bathyarchaeota archaeon]